MLKLLGVTAVPVAARGVQAADATGFGDGGYGDGGYGGSINGAEPIEPVVTTEAPGEITASAATFRGEFVDLDGAKTVSVFFSWRESGADSWRTTPSQDLDAAGLFSASLETLASDTTYEVRAVADAGDGAVFGDRRTFTTAADAAEASTIDIVTLEENSPPNPHAELRVEWAVSDANVALERITIDVFERGATDAVKSESVDVAGASAAGSQMFTLKKGAGKHYRVVLTVQTPTHEVSQQREISA